MSGHSKWHKIRHKKEAADGKKSKLFGQLARDIKIAARQGTDPSQNNQLREAIERAKKMNLPQENVERLLSTSGDNLKSVLYEGYGPGGAALLISTETDNTNRTVAELRSILKEYDGSLGASGSVLWKFSLQFVIDAQLDGDHDEIELAVIEAGADDISWEDNAISIQSSPRKRPSIESALEKLHATILSAELAQIVAADQQVVVPANYEEKFFALMTALEDHDDVVAVFSDAA